MARLRYNGLSAVLGGSGLTNVATAVTFAAALTHSGGTNVPTITGSDYIPLSILDSDGKLVEVVYLTAYTAAGTTGTITRAREGTTGVAHSAGVKISHAPTNRDLPAAGGILAYKVYNPGTIAIYTKTSATDDDVDSTNLIVSFVAPESGAVIVTLSGLGSCTGASRYCNWLLRDGSTTVTGSKAQVQNSLATGNAHFTFMIPVTGLTPGTSYTFKWGWAMDAAGGTGTLYAGGVAGPTAMKVEAAP